MKVYSKYHGCHLEILVFRGYIESAISGIQPILTLLSLLIFTTASAAQTPIVGRGASEKKVFDLLDTSITGLIEGWGGSARSAHHATVAMNDAGDILIAFNSERADFQISLGLPVLQQVEIAYFEFDAVGMGTADDTWTLISQQLVGSIELNPLVPAFNQQYTSCLKPDVVADGDKFFVVWTRQYDKDYNPTGLPIAPQRDAPSRLECVWVNKNTVGGVTVYNNSATSGNGLGIGFELDLSYATRDCDGTADAVVIQPTGGGDPTVAVVYPRQTDFGGYLADTKRLFDLALVTCSIDSSNYLTGSPVPIVLKDDVRYEGLAAPTGSAMVLPDAAPTIEEDAFWLTYEQQLEGGSNNAGRMALEYWKYDTVLGWYIVGSKSVVDSTPTTSFFRRRPTISSLPRVGINEAVSIAYGTFISPGGDTNVVYEQWEKAGGGLSPLPIPAGAAFPNDPAISDSRPLPVHGPDAGEDGMYYLRRCYFTRTDPPGAALGGVHRYKMVNSTNVAELISDGLVGPTISGTESATRPAAVFVEVLGVQNVPVIWEDKLFSFGGVDYLRIVLMVD